MSEFIQSGPMPEHNAKAVLDREFDKGWNDALEAAAKIAENFGNAPPNSHGRRARLAAEIRRLAIVIE